MASFIDLATANGIPRRLWGKVRHQKQWNRPDPLEIEGKPPSEIALDVRSRSNDARRQEDTESPAHAHPSCNVGSENGGDDFAGICCRERLTTSAELKNDRE
jgi:hypothetical protein